MSDYTQTYSFTKQDNVDIVEASDFTVLSDEFGLIETAVNSKADSSGDTVSFASLTAVTSVTFNGATVADLGTVTTADINGGTMDGVVIGGAAAAAATVTALVANTSVTFNGATVADLGTVTTADINGGTLDGVTIGGASAAAATVTALTVSTSATFNGATVADLGTVTTANIDGGTLDGVTIGGASAAAATVTTLTATDITNLNYTVVTNTDTPVTAAVGDVYFCDLSAGVIEVDLPAVGASEDGKWIRLKVDENASTNNLTIDPGVSDSIAGQAANETLVVDTDHLELVLVYDHSNLNWGI